ncbi:kinase-like domain-containing protein [Penicillium coprophilum]|uniref:kinase-like domain-containing protein n=1 Tax=Penicillium coprophilum TaxID=36646 RepID=UPI0023876253|nr:kinase-like domain-containing protein [Penicillium coprophilum]KAJ5165449.1 kinase-like domain-containing protein [Penicillium coprophilum]
MSSTIYCNTFSLPTIAETQAFTDILAKDKLTTVVRVKEHFAVNHGQHLPLIEAENLQFLADHTIPVPKACSAFTDPKTDLRYLVMEYIPGQTLKKLLPSLELTKKTKICNLLKDAFAKLREMPSQG